MMARKAAPMAAEASNKFASKLFVLNQILRLIAITVMETATIETKATSNALMNNLYRSPMEMIYNKFSEII